MLQVDGLEVWYGHIRAVRGISFEVRAGEVVALLGANGAGKSTTLRALSGLLKPRAGQIRLEGQPLNGLPVERIVRMGMAHVPEGRRTFPGLSVWENLDVATSGRKLSRVEFEQRLERVYRLFPRLRERHKQLAWSMSGGEQQMLAIGRALMANPKLLLLDEPSLGLAPKVVQEVFAAVREVSRAGTTILLVEQNARMALGVANRGYVIAAGEIVAQGAADELAGSDLIHAAYLGARRAVP